MATYGWRQDRAVADGLFEEGHRFSFLQAVRLLEELFPDLTPPAEGVDPRRELVRFRHRVRLDYPPTDVEEIKAPADGEPVEMMVNVLGLAGVLGPLPPAITELIMERSFRKDFALRDFLDIFNHRLVSLLYRTRKLHRVALDNAAPGRDRAASYLYSVAGLGTASLRGRMQVKDRALLFYAGLLGQQPRSMAGLEALLSHYFGVRAVGVPFKGRWHALEEGQQTRIGERGQNMRLGVDAVVGTRVWDEEGAFEIELGPLTLEQFEDFLPTGWAFRPLCDLVRFYVGDELDFSFRLKLDASQIPAAWLPQRRDPEDPARHRWGPGGARV
ncbi:MAG TPA: type VI secretion system baseplate subunit TssG, partial [Thermoanaerobaculia bacterium]|nr:type VI secretion system baseplate subunit TssG [Thermoanaerobaculia bacterium]